MKNHSSLYNAVKSGDLLGVKKFFASSNDTTKGRALYSSMDDGSGILQYIIKQYHDTNDDKYIEMFNLVLKYCNSGIKNSQDGNRDFPLLTAARAGYVFLNAFQTQSLFDRLKSSKEIDWNVVDTRGRNVLFNAILSNDAECCKIVLNRKETAQCIYSTENDGGNILHCLFRHYTAEPGQREVVNLIVNKLKSLYVGGNEKSGKTTWFNRLLLQKNKLGETPLHMLVRSSLINDLKDDIDFEKLLSASDLLARTKSGDTVINLAVKHGNGAVINALLGATPQEYSTNMRDRMFLINQCRSDQLTECVQTLLAYQRDLLALESKENPAIVDMCNQLSASCLAQLKGKKLSDDDREIVRTMRRDIDSFIESNKVSSIIRQNFNKTVSEVQEPLDHVMLASIEHWCEALIRRYECKKISYEKILKSLDFVKAWMDPQVIRAVQEVKEKSAASQRIVQECFNQISKMRDMLPKKVIAQLCDEKLEDLEKDCKELMAKDLLLAEKQTDLEFEKVLKGQLLRRNALRDLYNELQTEEICEEVERVRKQLEGVNELLNLTHYMIAMKSHIENIKKESAELDKKEKILYETFSGMSLIKELRNLVANRIALIQSQTLLEESINRDIVRQKRIATDLLLSYQAEVPVVKGLVDDLDLGVIQSNRLRLLKKTKLRLQMLENMLSGESCVESESSLNEQLKAQQDRLNQIECSRRILQQEIRDKQESGSVGELPSGLSSEIEQLKQSEKNLEKRIDIIRAAIGALEGKMEESKISSEILELKYALFENLTDRNFHILLHCKEMFGSYSTNDPVLVQRIIRGYKKFSNPENYNQYYALCSQLGVDIGPVRHAVETRDVALLSAVIDEGNPDVKGFVDVILGVRDRDFLLKVLTDIGCAHDMILDYIRQECVTCMYPELVIAMLVSKRNLVGLCDVLANNCDLFNSVFEASSCGQLSELTRLIMQSALYTEQQRDNVVMLKNKIEEFAFKCMNDGRFDELRALIGGDHTLIYVEKDGKSLLEIASDLLRQDLVKYIMFVHKQFIAQARRDYTEDLVVNTMRMSFNSMSKVNSCYVVDVLKEHRDFFDDVDSATKDELISNIFNNAVECGNTELAEYCAQICPALVVNRNVDVDATRVYGARNRIGSTPADTTMESSVGSGFVTPIKIRVEDFGALLRYAEVVVSGDVERFKKEVLEPFNSNPSNYAKRSHGYVGYSIFDVVAAFGNPEQWNKLENGYNNIKSEKKTKDLFAGVKGPLNGNRISTVCSPLQAAVVQNNMQMIRHFIDKINPQELKETYGNSKQNVFHICMLSQQLGSAEYIMRNSKFPLDVLISAFLQPDEKGITPFAMALQRGYKKICMDFINKVDIAKTQVKNLITNELFIKNIIDSKDKELLERLFSLKYYATESKSGKSINLKRHRIAAHSLFAYACKQNDEDFVKDLTKYYTEKELLEELTGIINSKLDVKVKVLETILSAIIAETTDPNLLNKIFNKVIGHPAAFEAFININPTSYSKVLEESFNIDKVIELNNPILLKGLIESGREVFKLKDGTTLSSLGLAVCFGDLLDVCCEYLKNNPEEILHGSVLPHGAILSNHVELLKQLIAKDKNLLMKRYDVKLSPYKEIAAKLKMNYGCKFCSSETIYDFAVREGASVEVVHCIENALLDHYGQLLNDATLKKVDNSLFNVVLNNADEVRVKYPDLYGYVIEQFNVEDFIRSAHPTKNNMFHLVNEGNIAFLSKIVEKVYKHAVETGNKKTLSVLVNQVRKSDGLSLFQYAALHGDYELYHRIKPCGDIASTTAKGANVMHLCAQSAMKDDKGIFEVENLLNENKKLARVSDKAGRSLLDYAAGSRVSDFRAREEIFDLILSKKMDKYLMMLSPKAYEARVIEAIFVSRNRQFTNIILKKLISEKKVGKTAISKVLLNVVKNTSDPSEKARLLDYQAELENHAEAALSFGESRAEGRGSPSSAFVQTGRSGVPQSESTAPLIQLSHDEESTALGSQATMTRASTQASPSAECQGDSETSRVRYMADTSAQADPSDDLFPESEIIVSSSKKAILDSQNEIESLIQSGDTSRCIRAINSAANALVFQVKTLSNDLSIAERAFLDGNIGLIEACMNSGRKLNPNITDSKGNTLLCQFVGYFERNPRMLFNEKVRNLFLRLCMDYGFDINRKNTNGDTVLDRLNNLVKSLSSSQVDLESSGINEFMSSLLAHSRTSDQAVRDISSAQNECFAHGSVYNLSNLVSSSKVLQTRFSDVFYEVCKRILSEEASKHMDVAEANYSRLDKILNDKCLRKTLVNTDAGGNNVLQKLCQDIASGKINARGDRVLKLFERVIYNLKDKDKELLEDLLFNCRNSRFENCVEAIPRIPGADVLFKKLEELLLKNKIAESCDFNSMLVNCAESANHNLYNYLRTNYAVIGINNVDINGNSSLCKAVVTGSQEIVKAVLSTGTNINRKDKNGNTPLHMLLIFMMSNPELVKEQHIALVKFLVSRGALSNVKNNMGISAIMLAESIDKEEKFKSQKVSVLESLVAGSEEHLNLKSKCISELRSYIRLEKGMKYEDIHSEVIGGVLSANMCNAKLMVGRLLNSDFCRTNELKTVKFNFSDTNKGYVQNVGRKRNYVVTEGFIKLKLYWTPVVPKGAKEQVVNVIVRSDGTLSLSDEDIERYGARGEGINFRNCITYIGGMTLEDALRNGKWRDKESPSKAQKRTSLSQSKDDGTDHGRAMQVQRDTQTDEDVASPPQHQPSRLLDRGDTHDHGSRPVSRSESQFSETEEDGNLSDAQSTHTSPISRSESQFSETASEVIFDEQSASSIDEENHDQLVEDLTLLLDSMSELSEELKSQILNSSIDICNFRDKVNACIKSKDREGADAALKCEVGAFCTLLECMRLALKKLYDQNADESFKKLLLKKYMSALNGLLHTSVCVCMSCVSSHSKALIYKVCKSEYCEYQSLLKVQRLEKLSSEVASKCKELECISSFAETFGYFSGVLGSYRERFIDSNGDVESQLLLVKGYQSKLKMLLERSIKLHLKDLHELEEFFIGTVCVACNTEFKEYLDFFNSQRLCKLSEEVNHDHNQLLQMLSDLQTIFIENVTDTEQSTSQVKHHSSGIDQENVTTPEQRVVQNRDDIKSGSGDKGVGEIDARDITDQKPGSEYFLDSSLAGSSGASDVQHSKSEENAVVHTEGVDPVLLDVIQSLKKTGLLENMGGQSQENVPQEVQVDSKNKILLQGLVPATIKCCDESNKALSSQVMPVIGKRKSLSDSGLVESSNKEFCQLSNGILELSRSGWDPSRVSGETLKNLSLEDNVPFRQRKSGVMSLGNVDAASGGLDTVLVDKGKKVQEQHGLKYSEVSKPELELVVEKYMSDLDLVSKDEDESFTLKRAKSCGDINMVAGGMIANVSSSALDSVTPFPSPGTGKPNRRQRRNSIQK